MLNKTATVPLLIMLLALVALTVTACKDTNSVDDAKAQVAQAKQQLAQAQAELTEAKFAADMQQADGQTHTPDDARTLAPDATAKGAAAASAETSAPSDPADKAAVAPGNSSSQAPIAAAKSASTAAANSASAADTTTPAAADSQPQQAAPADKATTNKRICADCGTITAIVPVRTNNGPPEYVGTIVGGVVGAVLGNQIGDGSGQTIATIVGAVGGALAGHETQQRMTRDRAYRVTINMDIGDIRTVTVPSAQRIVEGQRVRVQGGNIVLMGAR